MIEVSYRQPIINLDSHFMFAIPNFLLSGMESHAVMIDKMEKLIHLQRHELFIMLGPFEKDGVELIVVATDLEREGNILYGTIITGIPKGIDKVQYTGEGGIKTNLTSYRRHLDIYLNEVDIMSAYRGGDSRIMESVVYTSEVGTKEIKMSIRHPLLTVVFDVLLISNNEGIYLVIGRNDCSGIFHPYRHSLVVKLKYPHELNVDGLDVHTVRYRALILGQYNRG